MLIRKRRKEQKSCKITFDGSLKSSGCSKRTNFPSKRDPSHSGRRKPFWIWDRILQDLWNLMRIFQKGTKVVLDFGEILQNDNFYPKTIRKPDRSLSISPVENRKPCPHFTFFGFRYVRVTGWAGVKKRSIPRKRTVFGFAENRIYPYKSRKN